MVGGSERVIRHRFLDCLSGLVELQAEITQNKPCEKGTIEILCNDNKNTTFTWSGPSGVLAAPDNGP
jgi:hypothetical protein